MHGRQAEAIPIRSNASSHLWQFRCLIFLPLCSSTADTLQQQSLLWTAIYALLILMVAICALTVPAYAVEVASRK